MYSAQLNDVLRNNLRSLNGCSVYGSHDGTDTKVNRDVHWEVGLGLALLYGACGKGTCEQCGVDLKLCTLESLLHLFIVGHILVKRHLYGILSVGRETVVGLRASQFNDIRFCQVQVLVGKCWRIDMERCGGDNSRVVVPIVRA